jgi:hypothetical protein
MTPVILARERGDAASIHSILLAALIVVTFAFPNQCNFPSNVNRRASPRSLDAGQRLPASSVHAHHDDAEDNRAFAEKSYEKVIW